MSGKEEAEVLTGYGWMALTYVTTAVVLMYLVYVSMSFMSAKPIQGNAVQILSPKMWKHELESCKAQGKLMVVKFYYSWCTACKKAAPAYAALSNQFEGQRQKVAFYKLDVDVVKAISTQHQVEDFPSFLIFKADTTTNDMVLKERLKGTKNVFAESDFKLASAINKHLGFGSSKKAD